MAARFKTCAVENCNGNAHWEAKGYRGWCCAHYNRWLRHGTPEHEVTTPGDARAFFNEVVLTYKAGGCLVWPYARNQFGHAILFDEGSCARVARLVCAQLIGHPPSPFHEAAHSCGNGHEGCVSPAHLRWATPAENSADKVAHGTANRGSRHVWSRLTEADVKSIREDGAAMSAAAIGRARNISPRTVSAILRRETWGWLD